MEKDYEEQRNRLRPSRRQEEDRNGDEDSMDRRRSRSQSRTRNNNTNPPSTQDDHSDRSSASSTSQLHLREDYMEKRQSLRRIHQQSGGNSDHSSSRSEDPVWIQQKPALHKVEPQSKKHYEFEKPEWATGGVKLRKTVPSPRTVRKSANIESVHLKKSPEPKAKPRALSSQLEIPKLKAIASPPLLLVSSSDDDSSREDDPDDDDDDEDQNPRFWFRQEAKKDIPRINNPTPDNYYSVIQQTARWKTNLSPTESDMIMKLKRVDLKDDQVFASKESPFLYKFLPTIEEDEEDEQSSSSSGAGGGEQEPKLMCLEQIPEEEEEDIEFDEAETNESKKTSTDEESTISENDSNNSSGHGTKPRRRKIHQTRVSVLDEDRLYKVMRHALRKKADGGRRRRRKRGSKRTDNPTPGSSVLKLRAPKQYPPNDAALSEQIQLKSVLDKTDNSKRELKKPERVPSMDEDDEIIQNLVRQQSVQPRKPERIPSMDDDDDNDSMDDEELLRIQLKKTPSRPPPPENNDNSNEFPRIQLKKTPQGRPSTPTEKPDELSKIQLGKTIPNTRQSVEHQMESVQLRHVDKTEQPRISTDNDESESTIQSNQVEETSDTSSILDARVWLKKVPKTQIERSVPERTQGSYYKLIRQQLKKTPSNSHLEKEDSQTRLFKSVAPGADGEEELVKLKKVDLKDDKDFDADPPYLHRLLPPEEEDEEDHGDGSDLVCLQEVEKDDDDTGSRTSGTSSKGSQLTPSMTPKFSKPTESTKPKKERKKRAIRVAAVDEDRLYKVMKHAMRKKQNPNGSRRGRRSRRRPSSSGNGQGDGKPKVLKMRAPENLPTDAKTNMTEQIQLKKVPKPTLDDSNPSLSSASVDLLEKKEERPPVTTDSLPKPVPKVRDAPPPTTPTVKKESPPKKSRKKSEPTKSPEEIRAKHELRMRRVRERMDQEKDQRAREKEMAEQAKRDAKAKISRVPKSRLSDYTLDEANRQREKCWIWYSRLGCPNKDDMRELVAALPSSCDIQVQEIDLLPWMTGNLLVNVGEMGRLIRGDDLTKIVKGTSNDEDDSSSSSGTSSSSSSSSSSG